MGVLTGILNPKLALRVASRSSGQARILGRPHQVSRVLLYSHRPRCLLCSLPDKAIFLYLPNA
jgi:hypothetical protein